ncbi:SCAN domain-containing protein 3-like [Lithobates pipiens]
MACAKKRKVDTENRVFKDEWTDQYMFILPVGSLKPVCLICCETVALIKSSNVKRHYETKHSSFAQTYPQHSEVRARKITELKAQYDRSTKVLSHSFTAQQRANECSLKVAWILGQHKRPFTDGTFVKECLNAVAETLLEGKQKDELCGKINQIPLSASTATKKTEILTEDVLGQLDAAIQSAVCISLAIDESTDITDNAQLLVYVRFFHKETKELCEDLLGVTPLETHTRGQDIYEAIKEILRKRKIDLKKVVSVTTDGAPAMVGKERGAVARLKEDNPDLISYHCIIHQTVLCAILSDKFAEIMDTMMKLINFLRVSSSHQHRLLREFLKEVEANANDLLLHNNVRWLSKGNVLERFWSIRTEVAAFLVQLKSQKARQFSLFLQDESTMENIAFLVDITSHLNELNVKLQGKNNSICDLMTAVRSFQRKLDLFKEDLQGECLHFTKVKEQIQGKRDVSSFVDFINKLIGNFSKRFDSFSLGHQILLFIHNPFLIKDVRVFSKEVMQTFKWAHEGSLQTEMIDLQTNVALREHFEGTDPANFWLQTVPETDFPCLIKVALHTLTMFGSTYSCESAFSTMNIIKTKYRSRLTNEHLHMCMRMAVTQFKPRFKLLAGQSKSHFSH